MQPPKLKGRPPKRKLSQASSPSKRRRKDDTAQVIAVPETSAQKGKRTKKTPVRYSFFKSIKSSKKAKDVVANSSVSTITGSSNAEIASLDNIEAGSSNNLPLLDNSTTINEEASVSKVSEVKAKTPPPVQNFYDSDHRQEIVLMKPATNITLMSNVRVDCLRGEVELYGYSLTEGATVSALSTKNVGLISVKATRCSDTPDIENLEKSISNNQRCKEVMESYEPNMTVLRLSDAPMGDGLKFLDESYASVIQNDHENYRTKFCTKSSENAMVFDHLEDNLQEDNLHRVIDAAKSTNKCLKVLICGSQNSGKSTTLRYFINAHLSKYKKPVYYLDLDLGQSEFGPPGLISLVEITKPLLGPGFSHLEKPIRMIVVGSIRPDMATERYNYAVLTLYTFFLTHYGANNTLFINTMGWITGFGQKLLQGNIRVLSPTIVIYMAGDETSYPFSFADSTKVITLESQKRYNRSSYPPKLMRDLMLTSYFGSCLHSCGIPNHINRNLSKIVSWKEIAIYPGDIPDAELKIAMQSLLCQVVALCIVPRKYMKTARGGLLKTVEKTFENECVAYGIVRYIDENTESFGIMTPATLEHIARVNTLVLTNIKIPTHLTKNQEERSEHLPFHYKSNGETTMGNSVLRRGFVPKDKP